MSQPPRSSRRRGGSKRTELGPVTSRRAQPATRSRAPLVALAILALVAIVAAIGLVVKLHAGAGGVPPPPAKHARRIVLFLLEGASAQEVASAPMPHLRALEQSGATYQDAWIGQAPAIAAVSGATVGTGHSPSGTGVVGTIARSATTGQPSYPTAPSSVHLGSLDQLMEAQGVSSLAGTLKGRRNARVLAVGGQPCADAAAAATWLADYIVCPARRAGKWVPVSVTGHELPPNTLSPRQLAVPVVTGKGPGPVLEGWRLGGQDNAITRYAVAGMRRLDPAVTIIVFPEIAQVGDYLPARSRALRISALLTGMDKDIGRVMALLRARQELKQTAIVVTSGEVSSHISDTVERRSLTQAEVAGSSQPIYLETRGAAFLSVQTIGLAQPVAQALETEHLAGVDAVYYRTQHGKRYRYALQYMNPLLPAGLGRALAFELSGLASISSADVVAVFGPHVGARKPDRKGLPQTGTSGGLQWDQQAIPLVLSGAGFRHVSSSYPARLTDITPTLERVLGLPVPQSDGRVLADGLSSPTSDDSDAQNASAGKLRSMVSALRQRLRAIG